MNLVAKYTPNSNTITFDLNGGTDTNNASVQQTVDTGNTATRPAENPTKTNLTFENWYQEIDGETAKMPYDFANIIYEPIKLTAKYKYTVTFNTNGGSQLSDQDVFENEFIVKPSTPTKNGNIFMGWVKQDENAQDTDADDQQEFYAFDTA